VASASVVADVATKAPLLGAVAAGPLVSPNSVAVLGASLARFPWFLDVGWTHISRGCLSETVVGRLSTAFWRCTTEIASALSPHPLRYAAQNALLARSFSIGILSTASGMTADLQAGDMDLSWLGEGDLLSHEDLLSRFVFF